MPLFRRRRPSEPPDWAASLDAVAFARFDDDLRRTLRTIGRFTIDDGLVTIEGRDARYGLSNLVQQWALADEQERHGLIAEHFARMFALEQADDIPAGDGLLELVRPRLWDQATLDSLDFELMSRPFAPGIVAVLCVDLPDSVRNLRPQDAEETGRSRDELWALAEAQIDDGLPVEHHDLGEGVRALNGDSFFVASRLLDLERFDGPLPQHGALVAVPTRHMLLVHPIETLQVLGAVPVLVEFADQLFAEGPGSIAPSVFWWRAGAPLALLETVVTDGETIFAPSDELVEVLNGLAEPG